MHSLFKILEKNAIFQFLTHFLHAFRKFETSIFSYFLRPRTLAISSTFETNTRKIILKCNFRLQKLGTDGKPSTLFPPEITRRALSASKILISYSYFIHTYFKDSFLQILSTHTRENLRNLIFCSILKKSQNL